jgi:hypothetical protein
MEFEGLHWSEVYSDIKTATLGRIFFMLPFRGLRVKQKRCYSCVVRLFLNRA